MATNLAQHLELNPSLNLHDVAYTLQAGRKAFKHRLAFVCRDAADALSLLRTVDSPRLARGLADNQNRQVVFMFAGQGSQRINMARELYEVERAFREQVDLCAELLTPHLGLNLREILYPTEAKAQEAAQQINQTSLTQPALFVIEYALAKLWIGWGVKPEAMLGHSIGEYVAACLAGVLTLEEALKIAALRGQMMQQLPVGSMLAVALAEEELKPLLDIDLSIAAINGPRDCVVSGQTELVNDLETRLGERGVATRRLRTSHAFHSAMMTPILEAFRVEMQKINLQPPRIPYMSNVSGTWITAGEATDPSYWVRHLRQAVRFSDAVKELAQKPEWVLLELGPTQTLKSVVKQSHGRTSEQVVLSTLPQSGSLMSEYEHLLKVSGELWLSGVNIAWTGVYDDWRKQRVPLPTYPFERKPHWLSPASKPTPESSISSKEKKADIADWFYVPSWNRSVGQMPLSAVELREHKSIWLIFADTTSLNARLRERLEECKQEVVTVFEGERFERAGERVYTLNPGERSHYVELIKELRERELFPHQIFHLWGITQPGAAAETGIASLVRSQAFSFYSLLFLAQALGSGNVSTPIHIAVVTTDLQEVTGEELLNPLKATSLGARRVLAQEYPNLDSRSIDIVLPTSGTSQEARLIDALIIEAQSRPKGRTVAYRGAHRWVQSFSPARLEPAVNERGRLREDGVYLITNGLSELGLALAEHLFSACRARLILTTPAAFPARWQWSDWLAAHDEQDETHRLIEQLVKLEKSGAEVVIFQATTGNLPEFQRAVEMAIERFSLINGLIHAEDILGGGLIQLKTSTMADPVLTPKVEGTLALDALFSNAPLDFIVLFSSVIASAGGIGLVGYCAANAFLDAFAHYKTLTSDTPTVAIDWDILHWDTRQESLAPDIPQVQAQIRTLRDKFGIRLEEALEAFTRVMASNHSQVVVSTRDFAAIFAQQDVSKSAGLMEQLGKLRSTEGASERLHPDAGDEAPRNATEQQMTEIWRRLSGIERLGINENFFDLGGNSLLAIQLISQIRETFGFDIPINSLFDSPTIAGLSNLVIENQLQEQFGDLDKLLDTIEGLSKQEVSERLREELQAGVQKVTYE
jgi:acyl transferase domain-containing protein